MKANELMLGDLVNIAGFIEPRAHAITAIKPDEDGHYFVRLDEDDIWWDITCLVPIPLTSEILEKNGWEECKYETCKSIYEYKGIHLHHTMIKRSNGRWVINVDGKSEPGYEPSYIRLNIFYVHEFQHALRSCRIDKEIVL